MTRLKLLALLVTGMIFYAPSGFSQPQHPSTLPAYDKVAGVFLYWNHAVPAFNTLYPSLVGHIQAEAPVYLITNDTSQKNTIIALLQASGIPLNNIIFVMTPGESPWIRDHGPFSIYDRDTLAFIDFDDFANSGVDENLTARLAQFFHLNNYSFPWIFDGGNYMTDHYNRLYCTERLFTLNSSVPRAQIQYALHSYMGIDSIITFRSWPGDIWGHIHSQLKLLDDTTFIISSVEASAGGKYDSLEANYQQLLQMTSPLGTPYRIRKIPEANNWKSYIHSVLVNNLVLVPSFGHPNDSAAIAVYQELCPQKQVVDFPIPDLAEWDGALHRLTNTFPPYRKPASETYTALPEYATSMFYTVNLYPNPAQGLVWVDLDIEKDETLQLEVISASGKILQANSFVLPAGSKISIPLETGHFPPGHYWIRLQGNLGYLSKPLILY